MILNRKIPYSRQNVVQADIDAVVETLRSDFLTQGPKVELFEEAFAQYIGSKYAVAVNNGTAALHLCALVLGVQPGVKVITSPITFAASANCVRYCGGEVIFADIDPRSYCLDPNAVRTLLEKSPKGTYAGLIPVDFTGFPADMEAFRELAEEFDLWIIEDSCHAPGGYFVDSKNVKSRCGSGQYADLAIFSLHPVKHIAAGEGGVITTNDRTLYERLKLLRTHGIMKPSDPQDHGAWYYEMVELGYNYRITDIQAALAMSQLSRAEQGIERRQQIAKAYDEAFDGLSIVKQTRKDLIFNAFHLYVIEVEDRKGLYDFLMEAGIVPQVHYIPLHKMPYYQALGWQSGDFPKAESYYDHCLSLPMFPSLTDQEQQYVIAQVKAFLTDRG